MHKFVCPSCKWAYIVSDEKVFGPMWQDEVGVNFGRMMTREQWEEEYGDCARRINEVYN